METIREIFIKLGLSVEAADFAHGLALEHALEKGAELVVEAVEKLGEAFLEAIEKTAEYGEQMELLSQKTGIGTDSIQKLSYAATLSGSSADSMRTSLVHLARTTEAARDGNEEAQKSFGKLGISMSDVRSKSPEDLLLVIADRMQKTGKGTKTTASAMDLLGRSGSDLVPMLLKGSSGINALGDAAEESGDIMSEEAIKSAAEFEDSIKALHLDVEGLTHELAGPLIDGLRPIVEGFREWFKANRKLIGQGLATFAHGVAVAFDLVAKGVVLVVDNFQLLEIALGAVALTFGIVNASAIAAGVVSVAAAAASAAAWLVAAAPIVLIAAVLTLAGLAAEDLWVFIQGGDSVIGSLLNKFRGLMVEWFAKHDDWWVVVAVREAIGLVNNLTSLMAALDPTGLLGKVLDRAEDFGRGKQKSTGTMEEAQAALGAAMSHIGGGVPAAAYGNAAGPEKSAAAAGGGGNGGAKFYAPVTIHAKEGDSPGAIADKVTEHMERFWEGKMRETAPVAGN